MEYLRPLSGLSKADVSLVGGKAANLGLLLQAGLPVPAGLCLTTEAFDRALQGAGVLKQADALMEGAGDDAESLEQAYAQVLDSLYKLSIPSEIARELSEALSTLGGPIAVRSSATTEDTSQATFAGQYASFLNVTSPQTAIETVKKVWASLWSPGALGYRRARGIEDRGKMAVVLQLMAEAEVSGVAFTEDLAAGRPEWMTVSASFGLGEALVSGDVTPDLYTIERSSMRVLERSIGYKERSARPSPQGGTRQVELPRAQRDRLSLTDAQVGQVAGLALAAEATLGTAQDVEWALEGDREYLLQARPLVRRQEPEAEVEWANPVPGARWRRDWRLGEWLSDPVTPLFATSLLPVLVDGREKQGLGHLPWDAPKAFAMPEPWFCIVNGYFYTRQDPPFDSARMQDTSSRTRMLADRKPWLDNWVKVHHPAYLQRLEGLKQFDPTSASAEAILGHLNELYLDAAEFWYLLAPIGFGFEEFFFKPIYERLTPPESRPYTSVYFSGYGGKTLESQKALEGIAAEVAQEERLASLFRDLPPERMLDALETAPGGGEVKGKIDAFLAEYGCHLYSLDFFFPTMGERPDVTVTAIRNYLLAKIEPVSRRVAKQVEERERATRWLLDHVSSDAESLETVRALLAWHQTCAEVREDALFSFQAGWPLARRALAELGRRLKEAGALESWDDMFFLEQPELEAAARALDNGKRPDAGLAERSLRRREEWRASRRLSPPDRIPSPEDPIWASGIFARMPTGPWTDDAGRAVLRGQPASPGRVRGRARVVLTPEEFGRMRPGDILVAVATNPAWTPLFPLAAGVVTETGGGASHCSLVAREYGIPAVMGTGVATQVIRDGQVITVDGAQGLVLLGE